LGSSCNHNPISLILLSLRREKKRGDRTTSKMPKHALTDLIVALLHVVGGPRRHCRRSRRGGRRHRRQAVAPIDPPPLSAASHRRVLERPLSPSPDRPVIRPLLSNPDAHQRGCQGGPCAVHDWDCPNRVAPVHDPLSSSRQGEEEGGEEDEDGSRRISVVIGPVGLPVIHRTVRISIGPRRRPQGPLASWAATTSSGSPTPTLAAPRPPLVLPSSEDGPSGSGPPLTLPQSKAGPSESDSPPALLSSCGNRLLRWFAHLATPTGRG
jgi:hypothetical protein